MASSQSSQLDRSPELSRTATRALRTLGTSEGIQCTESLVRAYNANDVEDVNGVALHHWLDAYVREFAKQKPECMPESWIREYALLATIDVKNLAAEELVGRVYASLRACINSSEYCPPIIVVALDNMLTEMDTKIVEKETQSLISLAEDLLCLTDPKRRLFSRDTYAFHMACLLTLEKTLVVLHKAECAHSKQWTVDFFQKRLRAQLNAIAANQKYYPFVYNTQLIRCNIDGLIKGNSTDMLLSAGRRIFYALCGGLYLFQGVRELAVMQIDFAAIEAGVLKMQQAFGGMINTWAFGLKEVMLAAKRSQESQEFSHIRECYGKHKYPTCWDRIVPNRLKTIKFALVSHLSLFATENSASNLSDEAFRLLSNLATNTDTAHWRADPDIYECLLDALASVGAKKQPLRQICLHLLRQMEHTSIRRHQTVVKDWRGLHSVEQKLHKKRNDESEIPLSSLYDVVRKQLGLHLTHTSDLRHKKELREYYQDDGFAKVSLLLDDVERRHITDFDFHIVVYERVDEQNQVSNNVSSTGDDQIAHNLERCSWVQKPIKLQDIFAPRRQKPHGPEEEVTRVLLRGNPGTGKTSLSKRLCHGWAIGEWGPRFERVYLLPIRKLTGNLLHLEKTLEAAIAVLLFDADDKSETERNALQCQIKDHLDEKTTLLVLDGLDEGSGNDKVEKIVEKAVSRTCSVLALSRPHNLGDVRSKVDIEVECLGLNDDQLETYMRREAPDTSDELIQFLNKSPVVWETAKVPVNAQMLCTLWNSEEGQRLKELKSLSLKSLYLSMTELAWQRYMEKTGEKADRQAVFRSLEIIAFKSIKQSKIEIPIELVRRNAEGATTDTLLRDSGFLLFQKEGQVYQFAHLSFHEFFAGRFLAKNLRGTAKESKKAKQYIAERKYYDTSRVTLSFMTQCYCLEDDDDDDVEEDCIKGLKELLSILDEDPVEVVGFQHSLLKMRTLDAFLSVCGSCTEDIRLDDDLQKLAQLAVKSMNGYLSVPWHFEIRRDVDYNKTVRKHIIEDLGQMPHLFAWLPDFLLTVLFHRGSGFFRGEASRMGRLVSYAPEHLLQIVPMELRNVDSGDTEDGYKIDLHLWFKLFAASGPKCAILALDQLKTACQDQRDRIREISVGAIVEFLKVLPEREDLHSLCLDAMKNAEKWIRKSFLNRLGSETFEPNSTAANLAWTLTVKATEDKDEEVRNTAFRHAYREDQTSEASVEKMIELLLEYTDMDSYYGDDHFYNGILYNIQDFLRRFPAKLSVFLPYLADRCKHPKFTHYGGVGGTIHNLSLFLPTSQLRELGEMISRIYCDVWDYWIQRELAEVLHDIGQKIPEFMTDFSEVFSHMREHTDDIIRKLARERETMAVITSGDSVDVIDEVFWDQSFGVKKELLRRIHQERMINAETAEIVFEMAVNCLESNNEEMEALSLGVFSSLIEFRFLSNDVLYQVLEILHNPVQSNSYYDNCENSHFANRIVSKQPLDTLLEYFWETDDERLVDLIAEKHTMASVTYESVRDGKTIVSVIDRGKNSQQEVPTEWAEQLLSLVKQELHKTFGDSLP